jgi:hypothetical protein
MSLISKAFAPDSIFGRDRQPALDEAPHAVPKYLVPKFDVITPAESGWLRLSNQAQLGEFGGPLILLCCAQVSLFLMA